MRDQARISSVGFKVKIDSTRDRFPDIYKAVKRVAAGADVSFYSMSGHGEMRVTTSSPDVDLLALREAIEVVLGGFCDVSHEALY